MSDWHSSVYKPHEAQGMSTEEWLLIRDSVLRRDRFICLRCDKRFKRSELSAHHMLPRDEGGSSELINLVTLCNPCHDYVEINHLKTRADIQGSFEAESDEIISEPIEVKKWQEWVYGGARRPR